MGSFNFLKIKGHTRIQKDLDAICNYVYHSKFGALDAKERSMAMSKYKGQPDEEYLALARFIMGQDDPR